MQPPGETTIPNIKMLQKILILKKVQEEEAGRTTIRTAAERKQYPPQANGDQEDHSDKINNKSTM